MRDIAILVSNNCLATSITGPQDLFNIANSIWRYFEGDDATELFRVKLVAATMEPIKTSSGILIEPDSLLDDLEHCDFLLVAAYHYGPENTLSTFIERQQENFANLHRLHDSGCMIGAYCSGTFVLAASGLLDESAATTSWWLANSFRRQFPKVKLVLDELVVEQDSVWTAGATTSYLNLCLKVVEKLAGQQVANHVSKVLLVDNNRLSQLPYMQLSSINQHKDSAIAKCQDWIQSNLANPISLEDMSSLTAMSKRNFIRRFKKAVGETPASYLQRLRIEAAKRYLESTNWNLEQIVEKVGYEDASAFRRVFQKLTSLSPTAYRNKFSMTA